MKSDSSRLSQYRVMWILVLYDLPTETKKNLRDAALFRKQLLRDGFTMFQFSSYIRHCSSAENAAVHTKRVKDNLPPEGHVGILCLTDKQFGQMDLFFGRTPMPSIDIEQQLEFF